MEFVVVLPIYFILLGFAFVVGELSLHSIHLTAFVDRGLALTHETEDILVAGDGVTERDNIFAELRKTLSFDKSRNEVDYSYDGSDAGDGRAQVSQFDDPQHIDVVPADGINGHFIKAVAGSLGDNYALTPLSRGFASFWVHETERRVYTSESMADSLERPEQDTIDVLLQKGSLGRSKMYGNYRYDNFGTKVREFGYYSLQRNLASYLRADAENQPYRVWDSGALMEHDSERDNMSFWEYARDVENQPNAEKMATVKEGYEFIKSNRPGGRLERGNGSGDRAYSYQFNGFL